MEHENQQLERRHVQEHLHPRRDSPLQKLTGQRPAKGKGGTGIEAAIAGLSKELHKQDNRRDHIPDEGSVGSPGHAHGGNRAKAINQHIVADHIHDHAHEGGLHHNLCLTDTAKKAGSRIADQVDDSTEHQNVKIGLLVFQLVGRQILHTEGKMSKGNRQVQKRHAQKRQVHRLHEHSRAITMLFRTEPLGHHGSGITDGTGKEHGKGQLHCPRSESRIHFGRPKLREEQTVDKGHEGIKRHGQKHGKCHNQHILHATVLLEL